ASIVETKLAAAASRLVDLKQRAHELRRTIQKIDCQLKESRVSLEAAQQAVLDIREHRKEVVAQQLALKGELIALQRSISPAAMQQISERKQGWWKRVFQK